MKKLIVTLLTIALAFSLVACGGEKDDTTTNEKRQLVVSTWGLSEDVLKDDVYGPFEELCNCEVVLDIGGAAVRYTKLEQDPNSGIDVIELSQSIAANGYNADLFDQLDKTQVPNLENLIPGALATVEQGYGPAYTLNSIAIVYDPNVIGFEITEWNDLWKPELKDLVAIPNISTTFGPATVHLASDYKGVDITTDNGAAAFEALAELAANGAKVHSGTTELATMFSTGEVAVGIIGDFGVPTIQAAAPGVKVVVPSYTYANYNTIDINKNSENKDLAYMYINWRLSQDLQTTTAKSLNEGPVNKLVELSEEDAANLTYGKVAENARAIDYSFVNPLMAEWTDLWNRTFAQ